MAKANDKVEARPLVIVESPTKARTIGKFLGSKYIVKASNGHIRDLPNSASEVPEKYKKASWKDIGIDIEHDFWPLYVVPESKKKQVKELRDAVKGASEIFFATDEDREGESISWHLLETLKPTAPTRRLVFHEITKEAIAHALESARDIDLNLVEAQETRRIVDRLFGYRVSPLLWKKMTRGLSAGRVQSVAVRLLVDRERARIAFKKAKFWGLKAAFEKMRPEAGETSFDTELTHFRGKRVAIGKDFDPETGKLRSDDGLVLLGEAEAKQLQQQVETGTPQVASVEEKPYSTEPPPPYVTSTLQQEANRHLRFSARRTMQIAQQLYENGFITYMRTDSTTLSEEALGAARRLIPELFGAEYLPDGPRQYATKVRNAQEAHEAIRPSGDTFRLPDEVRTQLGMEAFRLYTMIWKRTVACQMKNAEGSNITVQIVCGDGRFRAAGKTVRFPGYLRAHAAFSDNPDAELAKREKLLPKMVEESSQADAGAQPQLRTVSAEALDRETQPPARYTEGSLIRELERLGIGRPSTWATIVDLVLTRSYAFKKGSALAPTFVAIGVVGLLEKHFTHLLDYAFTARLEDELDAISRGEEDRLNYLKRFYFGNGHRGLQALIEAGEAHIDPREVCSIPIGETDQGVQIEVRIGRYGPFLTDGERRASLPDEQSPDEMTIAAALNLLEIASKEPEALGTDTVSGAKVFLKNGRFGPYVQLGEASEGSKPKMSSLLPGMAPETVDLELALRLLSLPREIGAHPEDSEAVIAANGRFGPYVKWKEEIRSIPADTVSPLDITLEQAVELLKQPKGSRRTAQPKIMREVGAHPVTEAPLKILSGRFGPYVTDGKINASLRKGMDPESVSVEEAVNLLEERARRMELNEGSGARPKRAAGKKKATKKKATKKKVAKPKAEKAEKSA